MNNLRPHIAILIGLCLATVILWPAEAYPLLIIIAGALTGIAATVVAVSVVAIYVGIAMEH